MSKHVVRPVFCLVALTLFVSTCTPASMNDVGGKRAGTPAPAGKDSSPSSPEKDGEPVPDVLRFSAPRLGGGRVVGADYAGRDVALWFWAPW
jgi:hypothetical protein